MELFGGMPLFIGASFLLLKPYEDPSSQQPTGLTLKKRVKRQFLRL